MKTPKGFFTYFHHSTMLNHLTDSQAGRLYKALMNYGSEGELPDFSDDKTCELAFIIFKEEVDYNFERYNEVCFKKSEAAKERERRKREYNDD